MQGPQERGKDVSMAVQVRPIKGDDRKCYNTDGTPKHYYPSRRNAKRHLQELERKGRTGLTVYPCPYHQGGYHVGRGKAEHFARGGA
jgi:hypothetical protein